MPRSGPRAVRSSSSPPSGRVSSRHAGEEGRGRAGEPSLASDRTHAPPEVV
jgi:hypothetical protein